jgi:hypothetical protein
VTARGSGAAANAAEQILARVRAIPEPCRCTATSTARSSRGPAVTSRRRTFRGTAWRRRGLAAWCRPRLRRRHADASDCADLRQARWLGAAATAGDRSGRNARRGGSVRCTGNQPRLYPREAGTSASALANSGDPHSSANGRSGTRSCRSSRAHAAAEVRRLRGRAVTEEMRHAQAGNGEGGGKSIGEFDERGATDIESRLVISTECGRRPRLSPGLGSRDQARLSRRRTAGDEWKASRSSRVVEQLAAPTASIPLFRRRPRERRGQPRRHRSAQPTGVPEGDPTTTTTTGSRKVAEAGWCPAPSRPTSKCRRCSASPVVPSSTT